MYHSHIHSKRYHPIIIPQSQQRFNSVKVSHSFFNNHQTHLSKKHSLDSRPRHNPIKNLSFVDNVEDYSFGNKNWVSKQIINRAPKSPFDDNVRIKYFWRGKNGKSKKDEKSKMKKVKRTWSELGKHLSKKEKIRYDSISKY